MNTKLKKYFHIIAPGILVAATGVGAGDLITATFAGNKIGLSIIWAPLVGAFLKLVLTEGLVRNQIATNQVLMDSWNRKFGKVIQWIFLFYLVLWSYMVGGALINSCGAAMNAIFPIGDIQQSKVIWGIVHSLVAVGFILRGSFKSFEKIMSALIFIMFFVVIFGSLFFINQPAEIFSGLIPKLPENNMTWLVGLIGGVGGTLTIMSYGYWIQEEKRNNDEGLKICKIDLTIAYILTALFSVSMVILGNHLDLAGVDKSQISNLLANLFASKFGLWGAVIFKIGFWAGVFSSLLGVWQSVPYLFTSFYQINFKQEKGEIRESKTYRNYLLFIALVPISSLWVKFESIQLAYAFVGALFVPALALSLLILNNSKDLPKEYRNSWKSNSILVLCLVFFISISTF